jgi:hypothetical protein
VRLCYNGRIGVLGVEARCFWLMGLSGVCARFVHFVQKLVLKEEAKLSLDEVKKIKRGWVGISCVHNLFLRFCTILGKNVFLGLNLFALN